MSLTVMADSSGEEFYSAPESEEDTGQEQLTLDELSLSEESASSKIETETTNEGSKLSNTTEIWEGPKTDVEGQGNSSSTKNRGHTPTKQQQPDNSSFSDMLQSAEVNTASDDQQQGTEIRGQEFMKGVDNRLISDDHGVLEGGKVELTEEQIKELKEEANRFKDQGNTSFKNGDYAEAIDSYSKALELYLTSSQCDHEIAVCYANRAACHMKLEDHEKVIEDCTHTLDIEPLYLKAILRRAQASESLEKFEDALGDYQKALEVDPGQDSARRAVGYLPDKIKEQNEKLKEEMFGKLKELGNAVLKPFGLSTNNFQLQQDPQTGSYSVNFKK